MQRISPLFLLIPSYNYRLLDFEGHSSTRRFSLTGAFTLTHPVINAKSFPSYFDRAVFHYSRSPTYLRVWISRETLLCMYNQHARSASARFVGVFALERGFTVFQISVLFFSGLDGCASSVGVGVASVVVGGAWDEVGFA